MSKLPSVGGHERHATADAWRRLHPLSPVVKFSRALLGLLVALGASTLAAGKHSSGSHIVDLVLVGLAFASGVVSWLVTRWKIEGSTLRVESGLIRRDSRQVPLTRVQAIDVVQPVVGRLLGLAELRLRVAGSRSEVRLAYMSQGDAQVTRARLLAIAHGVAPGAPVSTETALVTVPTSRLVAAVALSGTGITALAAIGLIVGLSISIHGAVSYIATSGASLVLALVAPAIRQVTSEGAFSLADGPDGLRVRCGLIETVAETIPQGRVQAVRRVQPLMWRPFGWSRLEVVVAGSRGRRGRNEPSSRVVRALLPVGSHELAGALVERLLPGMTALAQPPPGRARWKAPLSYHFLAGSHDDTYAVTSWGRVCKVTAWVPLTKVQSLRFVQGPWQRRLGLANVHLDVAGRRLKATFRDRGLADAEELVRVLAIRCRQARSPAASGL